MTWSWRWCNHWCVRGGAKSSVLVTVLRLLIRDGATIVVFETVLRSVC